MKRIFLFALTIWSSSVFAQTIPNGGFETWAVAGPANAPVGWAISPGCTQSSIAHSGTSAVKCSVDTATNPGTMTLDTVVGNVYSGMATMGPPTPGANLNGFALSARPDSLTGYYRYAAMGPDSLNIIITISKWNTAAGTRETVGQAMLAATSSDTLYHRFSMPIQYLNSNAPDTCVIQILAADPRAPKHLGTAVWADDLAFANRDRTGVLETAQATAAIVYPNPFTDIIYLQTPSTTAQLTNLSGSILLTTTNSSINTAHLAPGIYLLHITEANGVTTTVKVVKQ